MNFFLLDKQQNIVKLLPEEAIIEAKLEEGINAAAKLNLTVDYTGKIDNSIFYLCVPTDRDDDSFLMLKIISETVHDKQVDYVCMESAYDELSKYAYVKDLRRHAETAGQLVNDVIKDTRWTLGYAQETDTASMNFYYQTVLECLQKIVKEFDVELAFDVYIDSTTNKINRRQVNVYAQMGRRTGKRFEYGSNLLSVKREESSDTIFTAIVGRGAGLQNIDDQGNATGGYTRRITFADVEWSKAKGDPLDKPKGQEWLEDPNATAAYGFSDNKPRIGLQIFEDIKDPNELLKATYESLKQAEVPQVQFSASVLDVGDLHLGDTVAIIRHDVGIEYFTRVFKVTRDLLDRNNNKVEFGDNLTESNSITAQISKIENATNKNSQNIGIVMNAANGKNKVFYTNKLPETADKGDICYLDLGNGETAMYIWDKGWHLVVSTKDTDVVKKQVEEAKKGIEDAKQSAQNAVNKADDAISKIGGAIADADSAKKTVQQVQSDVEKTRTELAINNDKLNGIAEKANQAGQDIVEIKTDISSIERNVANTKGDISQINQKADSIQSIVTSIQDGGYNLLYDTSPKMKTFTGSGWLNFSTAVPSWGDSLEHLGISVGTLLTYSVYISATETDVHTEIQCYGGKNADGGTWLKNFSGNTIRKGTSGFSTVTFTIPDGTGSILHLIRSKSNQKTPVKVVLGKELLTNGDTRLPWTPNINDFATSQSFSQISQRVDSIQSTVLSKADISQVTQLSNIIQSTVFAVGQAYPNGDFTDSNLSKYYDCTGNVFWSNSDWAFNKPIKDLHLVCDPSSEKTVSFLKEYFKVSSDYPFELFFDSCSLYTKDSQSLVYVHQYNANKEEIDNSAKFTKYDQSGVWYHNSLSWNLKPETVFVRVEWVVWSHNQQIETLITNVKCSNGNNLSSKITQLGNDINLRVEKGNLLSQINIEAGKTLIQSNQLYLDADTVTFSGKAFIPSAAITDLSADKITTGTLNAANVNVINLNVANLVGDKTNFVKSYWNNAYGGHVKIDGAGMNVSYGDWSTKFSSSGVGFHIGNQDIGGYTVMGMHGMPSWYQGLTLTVGADTEYFAIGAKDYHNSSQNPIPLKAVWMRQDVDGGGYPKGWSFQDDVYVNRIGINSIQYDKWNIHFGIVGGSNGFTALTLTSGTGDGFYWGSDGTFGYVTGGTLLYNVRGSSIPLYVNSNGTLSRWQTIR